MKALSFEEYERLSEEGRPVPVYREVPGDLRTPVSAFLSLGTRAEQLLHALAHLSGGLVREGDGQDALGRDPAGTDQVGDPVGQDARLAAARPRQDQQRTLRGLDGSALLGVQPLQYGRCRRLLHAGAHLADNRFSTGRGEDAILPNAAALGPSGPFTRR